MFSIISFVLIITLAACESNHAEKSHSDSNDTDQVSQDTQSNENKQPEEKAGTSHSKNNKKLVNVTLDRAVDGDTIKVSY
ncbi:endonuclease, partial [Bacillus spizizenii]|nr:endonuclease [Bacillus spizizenii]